MTTVRKVRFYYWLARDLAKRYTRSLAIGFILGFSVSFLFWQLFPVLKVKFFTKVERIGVVGEVMPGALPLNIQQQLSTGLTTLDDGGNVLPGLSSWWESTDSGKLYTFHLRADATWHNGKKVKAQDVNYNIRDVKFTAVDDDTLQIRLNKSYSPFPTLVAKPLFKAGLVGFGTYQVDKLSLKGDTVSFLRITPVKDDQLPVLEYRFYTTESQAIMGYKLGEVDVIEGLSTAKDVMHWGKTVVEQSTRYDRIITLFFNMKDDLFTEKSLRQALAYALPTFANERAYSPIGKDSWAFTDKVKHYDPNPDQVKKLFEAAKLGTESAEFTLTVFPAYVDIAQNIADAWKKVGLKVHIKVENSIPSNYQVALASFDLPADPDQYFFWHSTKVQSTNITNYINVKIDKLLEDARQEVDPEKRKAAYADFQRRLVEDAPAVFLYYPSTFTIRRKL